MRFIRPPDTFLIKIRSLLNGVFANLTVVRYFLLPKYKGRCEVESDACFQKLGLLGFSAQKIRNIGSSLFEL